MHRLFAPSRPSPRSEPGSRSLLAQSEPAENRRGRPGHGRVRVHQGRFDHACPRL